MKIAIVATLCHALAAGPAPACRDEVIAESDAGIGIGCLFGEAQTEGWKEQSIYRGAQWSVRRVRCLPSDEYVPKTAI